jgi:5-methylcytosine-specific restriction enzyme subunit McrC
MFSPPTTSTAITLKLREWQHVSPQDEPTLAGYAFCASDVRDSARRITASGQMEFLELREGLSIQTRQYVGSLQLGDLRLTILPKINGLPLLNLLRYTYHLRNFDFFSPLEFGAETTEFQDILIQQLAQEVAELLERGLYRRYERVSENLLSPRGRIDFGILSRQGGLLEATLPCAHFVRLEDNPLNQCLLAGLHLAVGLTSHLGLRTHLRQSAQILSQSVTRVALTSRFLNRAQASLNRLTHAYQPALQLIQLLLDGQGVSLEQDQPQTRLPGFLFDMNRFFQALLDRFLRENLEGYTLRSEYQLQDMLQYHPQHNPYRWSAPKPRPDFAILAGEKVVALLDAKYRDIGQHGLPREMLYQLAFYASSQDRPGLATILYPTVTEGRESWLEIVHPVSGQSISRVILRPVDLYALEHLVTAGARSQRAALARQMVFGG